MTDFYDAPGHPGVDPTWTSSAKTGVGTALDATSRVAFTISHGILNEIYYPRIDQACTRDCGLVITDGAGYLSEEKRDTESTVEHVAPGVPGYRLINRSRDGRYTIEKCIVADPLRDVVLQRIRFTAHGDDPGRYRVFALLAPHLVNAGRHNTAYVDTIKGWRLPFAEGRGVTLAMAASQPFKDLSVGFVGASDGFGLLRTHGFLSERYTRAQDGNVALTGELDLGDVGEVVVAIGFGRERHDAGNLARASLMDGYPVAERAYVAGWRSWQASLLPLDAAGSGETPRDGSVNPYRVSTAVLRTHEALPFGGGMIASLSIPWGASKGDDDLGGYHLVWPRDLTESASALLAIGADSEVRRVLTFLQATQEADGHWPQNMWLDGAGYWPGIQMDETGFPILLVDAAFWEGAIGQAELERFWPMVRHAARFIVLNGPVTGQDRWEEDGGYSPFTLAVEIAGLVVAADIGRRLGHGSDADFLLETADLWNGMIERWTYATDTGLCRDLEIPGYYVRISPPETVEVPRSLEGTVAIRNIPLANQSHAAATVVSPDALALVRFGLRAADDPRILDTVKAIDHLLKVELPQGPLWRRYNDDGYGEHEDGSPFDGTGIGRAWPLMVGERAHYELALGNHDEARRLLKTLEASSSDGGLIPEQIWDVDDIPDRELVRGRPSGSAMPLVWSHSEHLKLLRSLRDGVVFDMPPQVSRRYAVGKTESKLSGWRFSTVATTLVAGKTLRVQVLEPARVRWSGDGWATVRDIETSPTTFGLHFADLDTEAMAIGSSVEFTFHWIEADHWEGRDFSVKVCGAEDFKPANARAQ